MSVMSNRLVRPILSEEGEEKLVKLEKKVLHGRAIPPLSLGEPPCCTSTRPDLPVAH